MHRTAKVHAVSGVTVWIDVPDTSENATAPRVDVSKLPGAEVVAAEAWRSGDRSVVVGCVSAPSTHFVPGLEGLVLEKTTWATLQLVGDPAAFRQTSFETNDAARPAVRDVAGVDGGRAVATRHLLAFVGEDRSALVCTAVCATDGPREDGREACRAITTSLRFEGTLAPDPVPPWYVRALFWATEQPARAGVVVGGASVLVVGAILARRRRYG